MVLENALQIIQIILSICLVIAIVLQARGAGVGNLLGGADSGGFMRTRRGLEKTLFQITIVLAILFVTNAIAQLLVQ